MKHFPKLSTESKIFLSLAALYPVIALVLPANSKGRAQYDLSSFEYTALLLLVRLPIAVVWCLLYFAYRQLHHYTQSVKKTEEGKHFAVITKGMFYMVWGLLLSGLLAAGLNAIANAHEGFRMYSLITTNYLYMITTIVALSYVSAGAHRFGRLYKTQFSTRHLRWLVFTLVFIGVLFCYLMASQLSGVSPTNAYNAFYLPNLAVWGTLIIPYLYAWFLGIFAALELMLVARSTPGIIYKRALQYFAIGLVIIIAALIILQYFRSVVPRTGVLNLGLALVFTYIIYISAAIGALVMARGARRLKRIEEI